jgi:hypothetical protein
MIEEKTLIMVSDEFVDIIMYLKLILYVIEGQDILIGEMIVAVGIVLV